MEKQIPKLRFPEFKEAWNKKKLGEIAIRVTTKNNSNDVKNVFTNSAVQGIVNQRDFFDKDIANQNNLLNYYVVEKDDFIYNPRISNYAPVGPISRNHIGQGVMSPLYSVFKFKTGDLDFIETYFSTTLWYEYLESIANYGARFDRMNITVKDFYEMPLPFPSLPEQTRIASFFSAIDEKIKLETQRISALKQYKKGVMQKLFSQELRFKDENGKEFPDWEVKKLGEIAIFRRGSFPQPYGLPKWYDDENGMPFIQVFDVDDNMLLKANTKNKISKLGALQSVFVKKGTLVITIQGSIGRIAKTQYDAYIDRTLLIFQSYKLPINVDYFKFVLFLLFEIEKTKAPGGTIKTITKEVLTDFTVPIPTLPEQTKIANFLSAIDDKIDLSENKINKMQAYKKGLLQNMFV